LSLACSGRGQRIACDEDRHEIMTIAHLTTLALIVVPLPSIAAAQARPRPASDTSSAVQGARPVSMSNDRPRGLVLVTDEFVDRTRSAQLSRGVGIGQSLLLRSASSLTPRRTSSNGGWRTSVIYPELLIVSNSSIPFSQNNGSLWAGKGLSTRTLLGFRLEAARARLIFAPEIIASTNVDWPLRRDYWAPPLPPELAGRGYAYPFYRGRFRIDQPMRFGDRPINRFDFGQTSATIRANLVEFGMSNESRWWGPGLRNAIVLSNNAPGFPHLFLSTARPVQTRIGTIEARWIVGALSESRYFDTISTNNTRSIAAFAATLQSRWNPNLSFGVARSVYSTATGFGQVPGRWFDVVSPISPSEVDVAPDSMSRSKDQIFSLFSRWVFPEDGLELYGEWARSEWRQNLREFIISPNHSQGYTIGLQWLRDAWGNGSLRVQMELTMLEQGATFRDRPVPSWYTSPRVPQGYTHQGQIIGASIGPGASSQWMALDYLNPGWRIGAFAGRIRWNEDVHSNFGFPEYVSYCNHDLSVYPGFRGGHSGRFGSLSAEVTLQTRMNAFFQNGGGCPNNGRRLDIRNSTISLVFSPLRGR
jgi:hypothetical protein